jgi:hypothetical protein
LNLDDLPAAMTAGDISKRIRRVHPETLRKALAAGKISGKKVTPTLIIYDTKSVLRWLGLIEMH